MPNLRRKLPSPSALFFFEAAARCGSFTRAAEELCVSQPAVSRMLARLEEHLGVALFTRARSGTELTDSGRTLYRAIMEGFQGIEAAIDEIQAWAQGTETVTLSVSTAFTTHWLMPRMDRLTQVFPSVDLRFQLMPGRVGGPLMDVDLGMRFLDRANISRDDVRTIPEILLPVCSPSYHHRLQACSDKASELTLIGMDQFERDWLARFAAFDERFRRPDNVLFFSDYAVVVQAALLGQGIALGWLNVVSPRLAEGSLLPAVPTSVMVTERRCCLVTPPGRPLRPVVAEIRDWIIAEMREELALVDRAYPALGLTDALRKAESS